MRRPVTASAVRFKQVFLFGTTPVCSLLSLFLLLFWDWRVCRASFCCSSETGWCDSGCFPHLSASRTRVWSPTGRVAAPATGTVLHLHGRRRSF